MKTFKLFSLIALLAVFAVLGNAQTATSSTTLTTAMIAPSLNTADIVTNTVIVGSTTGMLGQNTLGQFQTYLAIDKERMPVVTVVNTTTVIVYRGNPEGPGGTSPTAHLANSIVWFGPGSIFIGSNPSGACVASAQAYLPVISLSTGDVITCDMVTSTNGLWTKTGNYYFVSPVGCGSLATTTTTTDNGMVPAATGNVVHQFTTNTTGGTTEFTCPFNVPSPLLNSAKGVVITDVEFLYGVQTTAISSIAAATVKSVTYPAVGGAAAGTVAGAGGTIAALPASLQKATTTTGLCYSEGLTMGTPIFAQTDNQSFAVDQVFTNSAAATVYQLCGIEVHYHIPL